MNGSVILFLPSRCMRFCISLAEALKAAKPPCFPGVPDFSGNCISSAKYLNLFLNYIYV
jgi:hypothetical protein